MGNKVTLSVDARELHGKKVAKLRKEGIIPGVIYGAGTEPISVQVAENVFGKAYRQAGSHAPVHVSVGSKKKITMIKDVDHDPVKGTVRHVSFHAVKANEPVVAEVPIHLVNEGESEAEKNGLIILQNLDRIEVKALPMDLPDAIEISTAGFVEAGERLTLEAATLPEGVEFVEHDSHHGDETEEERHHVTELQVASVWEPSALQAANEASSGPEDESEVEAEQGGDTQQDEQAHEDKPGGKDQAEPKQNNVDAVKIDEGGNL